MESIFPEIKQIRSDVPRNDKNNNSKKKSIIFNSFGWMSIYDRLPG